MVWLGVKMFGVVGAAIGSTVVLYLWNVPYNLIYLARQFDCGMLYFFPWKKLCVITIVSLLSAFVAYCSTVLIPNVASFFKLTVGLFVFGFVYFIMGFKFVSDIRSAIRLLPIIRSFN